MKIDRIKPVLSGNNTRISFEKQKEILEMPNLIEVQKNSYNWFINEGIRDAFKDIFPITDFSERVSLEYVSHKIYQDEKKYSIVECKNRNTTYAAPLRAVVRLHNKETDEIIEHELYMGEFPLMTENGTFIINGAERVVVSQLVRSPGIYYDMNHDKYGKELYSTTVIPSRGAWIEYETDSSDILYAHVDRNRKFIATALLRAIGYSTNDDIISLFGEEPKLLATLEKDSCTNYEEGLFEIFKKLRPGEPLSVENASTLINNMFFDTRRYDLGIAGRYKYNKKLTLSNRIAGRTLAVDIKNPNTGKVFMKKGKVLSVQDCDDIQNIGIPYVEVEGTDKNGKTRNVKVLSNLMVDINNFLDIKELDIDIKEKVYYPLLIKIFEESAGDIKVIKRKIKKNIDKLIPKCITTEDIVCSINYLLNLEYGIGSIDDIDHLGNRRIRAVGELLQKQYRVGLSRMERSIRERMNSLATEEITPQTIVNIKPVTAVIKEFFGSSQLSQFMDQNNPLSELTHKRRLSALGPGGLSRERAGFEVRDVHYTHYGRMCPIETPEGPNIGLINSLASFARINEYGFIEAPYRRIDKKRSDNPIVTDEVVYMSADEEDKYHVAQANEPLDEKGHFIHKNVAGRFKTETQEYDRSEFDYMDVSPKMVFSVATSLIPFLQNDDANRALMGSNMQRQAVPLMITKEPIVGTGMEEKAARDSGVCVICEKDGEVDYVDATRIVVKDKNGKKIQYNLSKFTRSNQSNCYNQRPIVDKGDKVKEGQIIADGAATCNGEMALGKNPLIGFMTWEGYNYEDAVLLSERLVQDDVYTSIHIEEYEIKSRDTKLGPEEITNDIPGIGEEARKELDSRGIIRIGAEVKAGDILVGKVTPKGESEQSSEEKLLRAIFGEKSREVRDTSLRLPHGAYGIIVDTKVYTREDKDELPPGVIESVSVFVAQKRKISVGDKMAGRHGNKGVVSRVLPVEDMPYLPNGRPLDIVLNPLGVPSRMNIGQVLETHLSLAANVLGFDVTTPVFNGAGEDDIADMLTLANDFANMEFSAFEKKYSKKLLPEVMSYLKKNKDHAKEWKGVNISSDGKVMLRDGRTGECFDNPVTIGHMHYMKLHHLVDDKIHARSTGPYSLVTQQPLGGKAQFGGQRFGEMEVWAIEAYGAAYTLQEILTMKSDDVVGRVKTYESIIKGTNIKEPGIPESFKVLIKEMQSLGLDMKILREDNSEINITEISELTNTNFNSLFNDETKLVRDTTIDEKELRDAFVIDDFETNEGDQIYEGDLDD